MGELGGAGGALATAPTPTAGRGGAAHPTARSSPAPPLPPPTNPALRSKLDLTRSHPLLIRDRPSRPCPARSPREVWGRIRPPYTQLGLVLRGRPPLQVSAEVQGDGREGHLPLRGQGDQDSGGQEMGSRRRRTRT